MATIEGLDGDRIQEIYARLYFKLKNPLKSDGSAEHVEAVRCVLTRILCEVTMAIVTRTFDDDECDDLGERIADVLDAWTRDRLVLSN